MSLFFLNIIQLAKSFLKHCSAVSVKLTSKKGIGFASVHISGECLASSDGLNFFQKPFHLNKNRFVGGTQDIGYFSHILATKMLYFRELTAGIKT